MIWGFQFIFVFFTTAVPKTSNLNINSNYDFYIVSALMTYKITKCIIELWEHLWNIMNTTIDCSGFDNISDTHLVFVYNDKKKMLMKTNK